MLALFILLTSLVFAGKSEPTPSGESISKIAAHYLDAKPRLSVEACNGLIQDILTDAGIHDVRGKVSYIWEQLRKEGKTHHRDVPRPGDLVFWHRTYDSNRNGKIDDKFTHIGVVIRVDENQTIHMVHRSSKGISPLRMNLKHPAEYKIDNLTYNDYLASRNYGRANERLSGQLFAGFASVGSHRHKGTRTTASTRPGPSRQTTATPPRSRAKTPPSPVAGARHWTSIKHKLRQQLIRGAPVRYGAVRQLTCKQAWAARNSIFARHGYAFETAAARQYFVGLPWYERRSEVTRSTVEDQLTVIDYENLDVLLRHERRRCER